MSAERKYRVSWGFLGEETSHRCHDSQTVIWCWNEAMRNTHYFWQYTLLGKRIEPNEFAQELCVRKIVTYNARLWGHVYGWGRHPRGSGLNGYIMWGKQKNKRDFLNTLPVHHDHPPICHSSPKLWPTDPPPKSWAMMGWWESGGCGRSRRVTPPYLGQWSWVTSLTGHIYGSQRCYEFFSFF